MALELQLSTQKADASLKKIEASLDSLRAKLDQAGSGATKFNAFMHQLEAARGINPAAVSSISQLSAALRTLNGGGIAQLSASLAKLGALDVSKVAVSVRNLTAALNSVRVPAGLAQIATQMNQISVSATKAASAMRAMGAATASIRAPSGLGQMATQLNNVASSAGSASKATAYFGTVAGNIRAGAAALGIAALGRELGQFVKGAYDAQVAYDKFNAIMNNTTGPGTAAGQLDFLRKVANETATDLLSMMNTYPKFAMAATAGGFAAKDVATMFQQAATMTRGFGLSTQDAELALRAITQMMTKGRIQAEELRQQLAERGVPAMAALAQATGKTTAELEKMMEQGQLTTQHLQLMLAELAKMSAGSVAAQLATINAQMTALSNSVTTAQLAFGSGFFPILTQGLAALNAALASDSSIMFFQTIGIVAGIAANAVLIAITGVIEVLMGMTAAFRFAYEVVVQTFAAFASSPFGAIIGEIGAVIGSFMSLRDILFGVGVALGATGVLWAAYRVHLLASAAASTVFALATRPWTTAILAGATAIAYATGSLGKLRDAFNTVSSSIGESIGKFGQVEGVASDAARAFSDVGRSSDDAAGGMGQASSQAASATTSINSVGSSAHSAADGFDSLASSARAAASAVGSIPSGPVAGGGGGGGGSSSGRSPWDGSKPSGYDDYFSPSKRWDEMSRDFGWRDGGIVAEGSTKTYDLPLSFYSDAPRFASGGTTQGLEKVLPDGGIPSILHPNEAVIPLAGGSVPVQLSGNIGGGDKSDPVEVVKAVLKLMTPLISINRHAGGIHEKMIDLQVRVHEESNRQLTAIGQTNQLLTTLVSKADAIVAAMREMKNSVGTSSGGYSGVGDYGGDYGGGLGTTYGNGTLTPEQQREFESRKQIYEENKDKWTTTYNLMAPYMGGAAVTSVKGLQPSSFNHKGIDPAVMEALRDAIPGYGGGGGFRKAFATGSPNAFDEVMGRSARVTIHPDEAVVPLPDGRSIPVSIPHYDPPRGVSAGRSSDRGSGDIVVNMTINAKDADSFRASEGQILQEMQRRMRHAVDNLGEAPFTDDPTVRRGGR